MINITKKKHGYTVEGHAEYRQGSDPVCSAVSAISQTTLLGLLENTFTVYEKKNGYLDVDVIKPDKFTDELIRIMFLGLQSMADAYPEHVQIKEEEDGQG